MLATSLDGRRSELALIFNDRSMHGQFRSLVEFREAIDRLMEIRSVVERFGDELYCHRSTAIAQVTSDLIMPQAAQSLSQEKRSALMQWVARFGPFWEEASQHNGDDDLLVCGDEVVSDTGIGEAGYCLMHDIPRSLVSVSPSDWLSSPLSVDWHLYGGVRNVQVPNYWDRETVEASYASFVPALRSWQELEASARSVYTDLTFLDNSFGPLDGVPFSKSAADRIRALLSELNRMRSCFDEQGRRTPEGHALYDKYCTGATAWFSDSSETEKAKFKSELSFVHPTTAGETLFCTWHGKVRTSQLRVHMSWPIRAIQPLYIAYVGPKITKR